MKDETGNRYSRLSVICLSYVDIKGLAFWECKCDCGNVITVAGSALRSGNTKSCGCLLHDVLVCRNETHGMYGTKQYRAHSNMLSRCDNPKSSFYDNYGGRGISYTQSGKLLMAFGKICGKDILKNLVWIAETLMAIIAKRIVVGPRK